ncbi:zincin [Rhizophagus irregularis]|uniref:Metalloendopeptidase n=1 Tax=Rhizophagus irregularis TaxID=588596 RepID=A0A2I1FJH0_9GLOM|nr:zincin [Rhizophagus irregularis]PKY34532.1 zincin [Rhizophagus irregularis]
MSGPLMLSPLFKENILEPYSDACVKKRTNLWPNGKLPYEFDNNVSSKLELIVLYAMKMISDVSSVKFVKRTDQSDYVRIVNKGGYWSFVGRQGKDQELSVTEDLQNYPHPEGNIVHELMHALGFYHEHCRPDRDNYLTVIAKENDRDFGKVCEMDVVCFGPYDPESIMHYPLGCYSEGRRIQAKPGTKRTNAMGQRLKLSAYDINALNALYPSSSYLSTLRRSSKMKEDLEKEELEGGIGERE